MFYIDARRLVTLAVEHGVLLTQDDGIFIYREAGSNPQLYPEGWYLEDPETVYRAIMHDEEGQSVLKKALEQKGVIFKETDLALLHVPVFHNEDGKEGAS